MRKFLISSISGLALAGVFALPAQAARNPAGTGQPGTAQLGNAGACGNTGPNQPPGFSTAGFANAGNVYAGSPDNPNAGNTTKAISEYDIACYQMNANGH